MYGDTPDGVVPVDAGDDDPAARMLELQRQIADLEAKIAAATQQLDVAPPPAQETAVIEQCLVFSKCTVPPDMIMDVVVPPEGVANPVVWWNGLQPDDIVYVREKQISTVMEAGDGDYEDYEDVEGLWDEAVPRT